jgi:hypothetical protein
MTIYRPAVFRSFHFSNKPTGGDHVERIPVWLMFAEQDGSFSRQIRNHPNNDTTSIDSGTYPKSPHGVAPKFTPHARTFGQ